MLAVLPHALPLRTFEWVQPVAGTHASVVQVLLSLQSAAAPPTHTPAVHMSLVVQAFPSLHEVPLALLGCVQVPPLHVSFVQGFVSGVQGVVAGSKQLSAVSLQVRAHSAPAAHGFPAWTLHVPALHVSAPLQNKPSLQAEPLGSAAVQLSEASLQDSAQFPSPSGPGHGFPVCTLQAPALHVSAPLQYRPSLQADPVGSAAVQLSDASLQDSAQFPSPSGPGHGGVPGMQPVTGSQVSAPLQ